MIALRDGVRCAFSKSSRKVAGSKQQQVHTLPAALADCPLVTSLNPKTFTKVRTEAGRECMYAA
jgi:hypothetical protein